MEKMSTYMQAQPDQTKTSLTIATLSTDLALFLAGLGVKEVDLPELMKHVKWTNDADKIENLEKAMLEVKPYINSTPTDNKEEDKKKKQEEEDRKKLEEEQKKKENPQIETPIQI